MIIATILAILATEMNTLEHLLTSYLFGGSLLIVYLSVPGCKLCYTVLFTLPVHIKSLTAQFYSFYRVVYM